MTDTQSYYVYENQRWNPLTGYSARGLPTDRPPWSDKTGKHKRSKDKLKLRSMHWQWVNKSFLKIFFEAVIIVTNGCLNAIFLLLFIIRL